MFHLSVCADSKSIQCESVQEFKKLLRHIGARLRDERHAVDLSEPIRPISVECDVRVYSDSGGLPLEDFPFQTLPLKRGLLVLILAIPSGFDIDRFAQEVPGLREFIVIPRRRFRLQASGDMRVDFDKSALLSFTDQAYADSFHRGHHLQYFSDRESQTGPVLYALFIDRFVIDAVDFSNGDSFPCAPPLSDQIPSCPFCAERLDSDASGLILSRKGWLHQKCGGSDHCAVCVKLSSDETSLVCGSCGSCAVEGRSLWLCLLCGVVGCGRYANACAKKHWETNEHRFCVEVISGRVWDYKFEKWVHRKIFMKSETVEIPEFYESATMLGISAEQDLAGLENEMHLCLETERKKLETACQQLHVLGHSEVQRHMQLLENDELEVKHVEAEVDRSESLLRKCQAKRAHFLASLDSWKEEMKCLKELTKSQLELMKRASIDLTLAKRLDLSRQERDRLRQEVTRLSTAISNI